MPLPTTVSQEHRDAINALDEVKAQALVHRLKLIKDICLYVNGEIQGQIKAYRLLQLQGSLFAHKTFIQVNNLVTAATRQVIADSYPQYSTAAEVLSDIQTANSAFNDLTTELENVISIARSAGQFVDTDPTTGELQEAFITEAQAATLKTLAGNVAASLG